MPWGVIIPILSAIVMLALVEFLRVKFATREDLRILAESLRKDLNGMGERVKTSETLLTGALDRSATALSNSERLAETVDRLERVTVDLTDAVGDMRVMFGELRGEMRGNRGNQS